MATRKRAKARKSAPASNGETRPAGARPIWSGTISFGLVSVPVDLFPAVRPPDTGLRLLTPDGQPLQRRYVCPEDGLDLSWDELVRGYAIGEDRYVVLTDAELEAVAPRKSRDIDLRLFAPAVSLDPFLFERAYVLTPSGDSTKPYRLLAEAMEREGKAGIATFVMRTKEYLVAIFAHQGILWAETLRFPGELRTPKDVGLVAKGRSDKAEVDGFVRLIRARELENVTREQLVGQRREKLRALVEKKLREGEAVVGSKHASAPEAAVEPDEAPDLFDSIRRSLQLVKSRDGNGRAHAGDGEGRSAGKAAKRRRPATSKPRAAATASAPPRASPRSATASRRRSPPTRRRRQPAASAP